MPKLLWGCIMAVWGCTLACWHQTMHVSLSPYSDHTNHINLVTASPIGRKW